MAVYSARQLHGLRVIVTGGGTGGHTYPALTTIRTLRARLAEAGAEPDVLWVGVAQGLEARVARQEGLPFRAITTGKLRRSPNRQELWRNVTDAFRIPIGVLQAMATVLRVRPHVVLSTGGYVSVPIGLAAWLARRPLVMHEQTLTLGLANRVLALVASRVLLSHASTLGRLSKRAQARAVVTGNPVRPDMLAGDPAAGRAAYGLEPDLPLVFVTGGAQGAVQVNTMVAEVLPDVLQRCQVLHQCGEYSLARMRQVAAELPTHLRDRYRVVDYIHGQLPDVLAAADIVVARSGAGTVAELTALGRPAILIPLVPTSGDEQRQTARYLAESGAARMLTGPDATGEALRAELLTLLDDAQRRHALAEAARHHGRPHAAAAAVAELIDAARRGRPPRN
ncbi:UDP-N-acetylglucosamine--N-acetylmuramyl-(pentapeptide) pyrophosphoryl-undecaprenol N-acetylglucosamine transferase [Salinispora arenicola]|uniref:UDP-N-acetylglucosamine--N-acetylmuramyl- (pentapeptide) pyrophosphoryl-undecaprenol N-acetylglucosamine transferase n=1 Tax=Salinispora arenicola TaxID=168697 RepID=UPI00035C8D1C|nr:UDP-N-acetylglucosamine--N-acetylmuramyl-(pentapeptide) pyrophosphoryl-undecaprenol N-acetylglucosamine transferase [Salinispora arenicola]